MSYNIRVVDQTIHVQLKDRIIVEDAMLVREKLTTYLDKGYKYFEFDLSQLDFIDSTGLGVLIGVHKRAIENGGSMTLNHVKGHVRELFELTRLTKVLKINFG